MGVGRMGDGRGERVKRGEGACLTRHCRDPAGTHTLTGTHPAYAKSPHDLWRGGMRAAWLASWQFAPSGKPSVCALLKCGRTKKIIARNELLNMMSACIMKGVMTTHYSTRISNPNANQLVPQDRDHPPSSRTRLSSSSCAPQSLAASTSASVAITRYDSIGGGWSKASNGGLHI